MHLECDFVEFFLRGQCYYKKGSCCVYFFFFWTGEPCNEIIRTKRSDFKEKILNKGVKNILIYTII